MVGIWETLYYKKFFSNRNNRLKCGDYSHLFSMCANDNEQHFN